MPSQKYVQLGSLHKCVDEEIEREIGVQSPASFSFIPKLSEMSAFKVLKKFNQGRKNRHKTTPLERSSSNIHIKQFATLPSSKSIDLPIDQEPFRRRAKTFTGDSLSYQIDFGADSPQPTDKMYGSMVVGLEELQKTLSSPRHYLRRRALVESELHDDVASSFIRSTNSCADSFTDSADSANSVVVHLLVDGYKITDRLTTTPSQSLCDILEFMLLKHSIDLSKDLKDYNVTSTATQEAVVLDRLSTEFNCQVIAVKNKEDDEQPHPQHGRQSVLQDHRDEGFYTVKDCLDYFDVHGLIELPLSGEDESYQLPRVAPLEPIASDWEALPIDPQVRNSLLDKDIEQQRAIWELIYNEHSHLRTLETIVNVFMRCLELIHRARVFTEDNYHNIFGYMEDLYHAHDQLWTYTFEPCLSKTYETNMPLDLGEIINRFPKSFGSHFEIYEQHCTLDSLNLSALHKASSNPGFSAYLSWCEARSECNRQKLKEMLAKPMQQLTRYHLLINAILKKTTLACHRQGLEKILDEVTSFVHVVDNGLRMQEEAERVRDAMNRITSYSVANVPHELKDLVQSYTHLDLLAPMPDVELNKPRLLMVEGSLHFRDNVKPKMSAVYVFLFTDMLLITKPIRKTSADRYKVIYPPFKITSVVVHFLTAESICCLVLNDYNVLSSWFILKAHSAAIAGEWLKQITAAQQFYQDAMDKKAQTWKLMENLRSERILHGVENVDSLGISLSQSLWSINSTPSKRPEHRTEPVLAKRASTPSLGLQLSVKSNLSDTTSSSASVDKPKKSEYKNSQPLTGPIDMTNIRLLQLKRTSSFGGIGGLSREQSGMRDANSTSAKSKPVSTVSAPSHETNVSSGNGHLSCHEEDKNNSLNTIPHSIQRFPISDASSTESSEVSYDDDYSRGTGVARVEASSSYKLSAIRRGKTRTRKSAVNLVKPVLHSQLDPNDDLTLQSPPNSSPPLKPILRFLPICASTDIKEAISGRANSEGVDKDVFKSSSCIDIKEAISGRANSEGVEKDVSKSSSCIDIKEALSDHANIEGVDKDVSKSSPCIDVREAISDHANEVCVNTDVPKSCPCIDIKEEISAHGNSEVVDKDVSKSSPSINIKEALSGHADDEYVDIDVPKSFSCTTLPSTANTDSIRTNKTRLIEHVQRMLSKIKSRSEGSLGPDVQKFPPGFAEVQINNYHGATSLVRSRSFSESSLFVPPSNSSYFDVVYVRDTTYSKSEKPDVETVNEDEEQTKAKNDGAKESKTMEGIEKSTVSSGDTELLQKSTNENEGEIDCLQKCNGSDAEQEDEGGSDRQTEIEQENVADESKLESQHDIQKDHDKCDEVLREPSFLNQTLLSVTDSAAIEKSISPEDIFTEINSFSESDSEVQLEPTEPKTTQLTSGWQPCKSAPVESSDCLSSHASLDEITVIITDKECETSFDKSTAILENKRKMSISDQANDGGRICTSNQDSQKFPVELLSLLTSESHKLSVPKKVKGRPAQGNTSGKTVRELSKIFEYPQESHARIASLHRRTSKERNETATKGKAALYHTAVERTSKKLTHSPSHTLQASTSPECKSDEAKHQKVDEKPLVCQKRKEPLSRIPVTTERRKSHGTQLGESNGKHRPSLTTNRISVKQLSPTSQVSTKTTTRPKNPPKPKISHIPEPKQKPVTKASSPSQSPQSRNRLYRQSPVRASPPKTELLLSNTNANNKTSSTKLGVVTPTSTSMISLSELEKKPDGRKCSLDETSTSANRTNFQPRSSSAMLGKHSTQGHSFGFHSKLKLRQTLDQMDVPVTSDSSLSKPTKSSPTFTSHRERSFGPVHQLYSTEKLNGNKCKQIS